MSSASRAFRHNSLFSSKRAPQVFFSSCRQPKSFASPISAPSAPTTRQQLYVSPNYSTYRRGTRSALSGPPSFTRQHRKAAISLTQLLIAAATSVGVACIGLYYTTSRRLDRQEQPGEEALAPSARDRSDMAPCGSAPGRPGNLTPDQETKLKDMWAALSDIAGISHHGASPANGTTTPSKDATAETTPKKKSRFGFGRKKDKEEDAPGPDNDKHGQVKEYQQALASLTPEQLRNALWSMSKHDDPDALLLRFLRARKWDVQAALIMLVSTMHWRSQEMHVDDDIMLNGEGHALRESKSSAVAERKEGEDFLAQLRMGKSFLHGIDKDGRPCCYVRVRLHRQGEQTERSLERVTVYTIETTRMMLRPPVDTATIVFDMTDFSMANMDYTPVKFMIKCFEANYPESLGSVVVYKSPWIFQGIWKMIKGWLDPVVASKVHFASQVSELEAFIPRDRIMKDLGGDEDYSYSYPEPVEGENKIMEDTATRDKILEERKQLVKSYEMETQAWIQGEDSGEGRPRLAQRLAENYWKLDPYVRARSMYDRLGVIKEAGQLDFYPSKRSHATANAGGEDELD